MPLAIAYRQKYGRRFLTTKYHGSCIRTGCERVSVKNKICISVLLYEHRCQDLSIGGINRNPSIEVRKMKMTLRNVKSRVIRCLLP